MCFFVCGGDDTVEPLEPLDSPPLVVNIVIPLLLLITPLSDKDLGMVGGGEL
jgi:hypothetical protein